MSSPKITTWIACLAFLYAGIPGLAQEVRHSGTVVAYGNTGSLQAEGNYDEPPLFTADGQAALEQWLAENITYPTNGFENGLHGKVTVRFTVEPTAASTASKQRHTTTQLSQRRRSPPCTGRPAGCRGEREANPSQSP